MTTMTPTARAAEPSKLEFVADVALAEPTLIIASNGDYLDIEPGEDGAPARLTTVPVSRVRHAFRVHRLQDTRTRRWKVEIEPVPLVGAPLAEMAKAEAAPPRRFVMDLAYHGCMNFELSIPKPRAMATAVDNQFLDTDANGFFAARGSGAARGAQLVPQHERRGSCVRCIHHELSRIYG